MYKGPENGQGISVYHGGELQGSDTHKDNDPHQVAPSGVLKIGKLFEVTTGARYAKLVMDELLIWNQQLSSTEIEAVMQMVQAD